MVKAAYHDPSESHGRAKVTATSAIVGELGQHM